MKVRELIRQLQGVSPDLDVVVRATSEREDGDEHFCGGIVAAALERSCDDEPFFAIDCSDRAEPLPRPAPVLRLVHPEQLFDGVVSPQRILATVARAFELDARALSGPSKTRTLTEARFICWWLLRAHTRLSLPAIGRMFRRDHTTILAGIRKCEALRESNLLYRQQVASLQSAVLG